MRNVCDLRSYTIVLICVASMGCASGGSNPARDIQTPEQVWAELLDRMQQGDVSGVEKLTTPEGFHDIIFMSRATGLAAKLQHVGFHYAGSTMRPSKSSSSENRATYYVGPVWVENGVTFVKDNGRWKLDEWAMGQ